MAPSEKELMAVATLGCYRTPPRREVEQRVVEDIRETMLGYLRTSVSADSDPQLWHTPNFGDAGI
jgi:hypothetical protein